MEPDNGIGKTSKSTVYNVTKVYIKIKDSQFGWQLNRILQSNLMANYLSLMKHPFTLQSNRNL